MCRKYDYDDNNRNNTIVLTAALRKKKINSGITSICLIG